MSREYVLEFDVSPELLKLIDAHRGEMPRDQFLIEALNRGFLTFLNEPQRIFEPTPFEDDFTSFRAHPVS